MPLEIREHSLNEQSPEYFARVLGDSPEAARALHAAVQESHRHRAIEGIFNARPVALLLAHRDDERWRIEWLVVHPATRGRGVGRETLDRARKILGDPELPESLRQLARDAGGD